MIRPLTIKFRKTAVQCAHYEMCDRGRDCLFCEDFIRMTWQKQYEQGRRELRWGEKTSWVDRPDAAIGGGNDKITD